MLLQENESLTMRGELKFVVKASKSFKKHLFEISDGKLKCYKNKSVSVNQKN